MNLFKKFAKSVIVEKALPVEIALKIFNHPSLSIHFIAENKNS